MEERVIPNYDECEMKEILRKPWALKLMNDLQEVIKKYLLCWYRSVIDLGEEDVDLQEWSIIFKNQIEERLIELLDDILDLRRKVVQEVQDLLSQLVRTCKELQVPVPLYDGKLSLYQQLQEVRKTIEKYEDIKEDRKKQLRELRENQLRLCTLLGETPIILEDKPLPSESEIHNLKEYIQDLEAERLRRKERALQLRNDIVMMAEQLNFKPSSNFEEEIIFSSNELAVTKKSMSELENLYTTISEELREVKEKNKILLSKIEDLWNLLDVDVIERDAFRERCRGHSLDVLNSLKEELQRCKALVKENLKVFIEKRRKQLEYLWNKCHCSEDDKCLFSFFNSDVYTEDLLEIFEIEIEKWQKYYDSNKEFLCLLDKHKSLWLQMQELETAAEDINRYKNRGGKLLLVEKNRKALSKKIPACEERIKALNEEHKAVNGKPFKTFGKTIDEYFQTLYEEREKHKRGKMTLQTKNTSDKLLYLSISPSTSGLKKSPLSKSKSKDPKPRLHTKVASPAVIKITSKTTRRSITRQLLCRKRHYSKHLLATSGCKALAENPSKENRSDIEEYESDEEDFQYPVFEKVLANKDSCRSTAFPSMDLSTVKSPVYEKSEPRPSPPTTPKMSKSTKD